MIEILKCLTCLLLSLSHSLSLSLSLSSSLSHSLTHSLSRSLSLSLTLYLYLSLSLSHSLSLSLSHPQRSSVISVAVTPCGFVQTVKSLQTTFHLAAHAEVSAYLNFRSVRSILLQISCLTCLISSATCVVMAIL